MEDERNSHQKRVGFLKIGATMKDLKQIIMRGYESKNVDYKGPGKWDETDKKACCELVKDILAMSNSEGGFLVIGVAEKGGEFQHVGLSVEELRSYETSRVNRFLQNYADPPINCLVVKEQIYDQTFIIIEVPGFKETPHLCQKEFPGVLKPSGLYVRTDNNESALVQSSADFRRVVERAVRNKQDELLESFRAILTNSAIKSEEQYCNKQYEQELANAVTNGNFATFYKKNVYDESKYEGYREFWCYPSEYIQNRFSLAQIHTAAKSADVDFRGWPFLYYGNHQEDKPYAIDGGIEAKTRYVDFANQDRADYWQFQQSGLFYHRRLMWEESMGGKIPEHPVMLFKEPALYSAEGLHTMIKLFENLLDVDEEVKVGLRVTGTQGRMLVSDSGPLRMQYIAMMPSITFEKARSLAD